MTNVMTNVMAPSPTGADATEDLAFVWRWLLLGGAAGGWAGFLIGGVGGRIAMFVLRVTSSDSVRGIQSDDDFTIGRISGASAFLLGITTILGVFVGIVLVVARSQLPGLSGASLIVLAAGTFGAGAIIEPHGVDFTRLSPLPLACAMFTVIPVAAAALILWLVARWRLWWWQKRGRTALASLPWIIALPVFFVSIPFVLVSLAIGVGFLRVGFLRQVATGQVGRAVATVLTVAVIAIASVGLLDDIAEIV